MKSPHTLLCFPSCSTCTCLISVRSRRCWRCRVDVMRVQLWIGVGMWIGAGRIFMSVSVLSELAMGWVAKTVCTLNLRPLFNGGSYIPWGRRVRSSPPWGQILGCEVLGWWEVSSARWWYKPEYLKHIQHQDQNASNAFNNKLVALRIRRVLIKRLIIAVF